MANQYKTLGFESGRLYNTSRLIDGRYVDLLEKISVNNDMKHFVIGPLNPVEVKGKTERQRHWCLDWLDRQKQDSVIYVSFGSSTSLSYEQIRELATGLETSEQNFLWVLRNCDAGDIFTESGVEKPELPQGYEERVKNRGIVVQDWAPQLDILAHTSTGGFMSHCGWNSCIESISMGVPIVAWPMHSDQPKNSIFLRDVLKICLLVRKWEKRDELVRWDVVENCVSRLMVSKEGEEMRRRANELGRKVRDSVEIGGTSYLERDSFITHISR